MVYQRCWLHRQGLTWRGQLDSVLNEKEGCSGKRGHHVQCVHMSCQGTGTLLKGTGARALVRKRRRGRKEADHEGT